MQMSSLIKIVMLSCFALAEVLVNPSRDNVSSTTGITHIPQLTTTFSEHAYRLQRDEIIQRGNVHLYTNIESFSAPKHLENNGGLSIVGEKATVRLGRFSNNPLTWARVHGHDHLRLEVRDHIFVSPGSHFVASSDKYLELSGVGIFGMISNGGNFDIIAPAIEFVFYKKFVNSNLATFKAADYGVFDFDSIDNKGSLHIEAGANSFLSFNELVNSGHLFFRGASKGENPSSSEGVYRILRDSEKFVVSDGYIENTGVIAFYVDQGHGKFIQEYDIQNEGLICLGSTSIHQWHNIKGWGCIVLANRAHFDINGSYDFDSSQSILLRHPTLYINIVDYGVLKTVYDIYGFLQATSPIRALVGGIYSVNYDTESGVLWVFQNRETRLGFRIGTGFDGHFSAANNTVIYEGGNRPDREDPLDCHCKTPLGSHF